MSTTSISPIAFPTTVIESMGLPFTLRLAMRSPVSEPDLLSHLKTLVQAQLDQVDRDFSPFKADSLVSRFQRGDWRTLLAADQFQAIYAQTQLATEMTEGYFDPQFNGVFDPTGLVKGWAIERAVTTILRPQLAMVPGLLGVSLNGGGDVQMAVAPHTEFRWDVGVADPQDATTILGQYAFGNGAIATSGMTARGEHIKRAASPIEQVTIIDTNLTQADIWATAGIAAGTPAFLPLIERHQLSGVLVDRQQGQLVFSEGVIHHV